MGRDVQLVAGCWLLVLVVVAGAGGCWCWWLLVLGPAQAPATSTSTSNQQPATSVAAYRATLLPAIQTELMRRTLAMLASGSASSTTKSAHLPRSMVPRSRSRPMQRAATALAEFRTAAVGMPAFAIISSS